MQPIPDLVYDLGLYDAADTRYFLSTGHRVVAVEANPALVSRAHALLAREIASGQLTIINAAIAPTHSSVTLTINRDNLGGSSTCDGAVAAKNRGETIVVQGITLPEIFEQHGIPKYLKVDIEGCDSICVRTLTRETRPTFVSFELGADIGSMIDHLQQIGFTRFKVIDQAFFRELSRYNMIRDRAGRSVMRFVGYAEPTMVRRGGRFFTRYTSSGPAPWESDGPWRSARELLAKWRTFRNDGRNIWFDVQAC